MVMRATGMLEQRARLWLDRTAEIARRDDDEEWQTVSTSACRLRPTQQLAREHEVVDQALAVKAWDVYLEPNVDIRETDRLVIEGERQMEVQGVDNRYEGPYLKVLALEVT